jgi:hypothetical protein
MEQQAYRGGQPRVSIHFEGGQVILQLRDSQSTLALDPDAARDLAGQLVSPAIEVQMDDDRVLGVRPDGVRSEPERERS